MLSSARENVQKFALHKTVAAAVSGGADSMALFFLLLRYHEEGRLTLKVLTVDHGIRKSGAADAAFVQEICEKKGIECRVHRLNVPQSAKKAGRGIEAEAHILRKEIYRAALNEGWCDLVATAHHLRDNAETVLLHLFRGCGLKGLSGMAICREGIFRPLLHTDKAEIDAFVEAERIPFVTDETNADTSLARNYVRRIVLPAVRARFPQAEEAIARTALFAGERVKEGHAAEENGVAWVDEEALTAENIFEALRLLGREQDIYAADILRVQNLVHCKPCAKATLAGGVTAAREYGRIAFYRAQGALSFAPVPFAEGVAVGGFRCGDTFVSITPVPARGNEKGALYLDANKVPAGAVWRLRREGDCFTPFGGGAKKLKKYFIDKKIPLRKRDALPLLCNEGEVLVIAGVEIADAVKVEGEGARVLCVKAERDANG